MDNLGSAKLSDIYTEIRSLAKQLDDMKREAAEDRLKSAVNRTKMDSMETIVVGMQDNVKWLIRLILGGFVMSIVAYALSGGLSLA